MKKTIDIGSRRELFVDRYLVEALNGVAFKLHQPHLAASSPGSSKWGGAYTTVLIDGERYRAYYRSYDPAYTGDTYDCSPGEVTCMVESDDGVNWCLPDFGHCKNNGLQPNNAVFHQAPYSHNFAPFLDTNPDATPETRYKALAGVHPGHGSNHSNGLHVFGSPDGIHWTPLLDHSVITYEDYAFDSQNVSFWSEAEGCYVCYFRTWVTPLGRLRTVSRSTSPDFLNWTESVPMNPNVAGEELYTSQTHPYFRAPHIYVALPTRFMPERGSSTDILFMSTRAGSDHFDRLFTEAFVLPGPEPQRWGNRSNYASCGVVPTGPNEMSFYHGPTGRRYTLRTDGFISIRAGCEAGSLLTKAFVFSGEELSLNVATSAAGSVRVELQDEDGQPIPGRSLADADEIVGDTIDQRVTWRGEADVSNWAGQTVRLQFVLCEADLYSFCFSTSFYGPAAPVLRPYFKALQNVDLRVLDTTDGKSDENLERLFSHELVHTLAPIVDEARAAVRGQSPFEARLAPIMTGDAVARGTRDILNTFPTLSEQALKRRLDALEAVVAQFNRDDVFGRGLAIYPPTLKCWKTFRKRVETVASMFASAFLDPRIVQDISKDWRFQIDPKDMGFDSNWMQTTFDATTWPQLNADHWWQEQGYRDYHGVAWYRRVFDAPKIDSDRKAILFFGAVDGDATVFVNDQRIGEHCLTEDGTGWDQPFYFDITAFLKADAPNLIAVRVRKAVNFAGIFRGVKLLDVNQVIKCEKL